MNLVYRQGKMFKLDVDQLPASAKNTATMNALYADIYLEFRGASENKKYKSMNLIDRLDAVNQFALTWLDSKGYK
jgi:hypothetical protein